MTVIAVLADPPREGLVLPELAATSPLSEAEAAECYAAMLQDVVTAVARSGGDLLVNYRPDDSLPETHADGDAEAEVRAVVADALGGTDDVRFEVQVGSTFDARAGNTVTHLLRDEGATSAAVVRGNAPFLARTAIDSAAMKLRSTPIVLGPATEGRTYYAAFAEPIDFEGAFETPELSTLTDRGRGADLDVDFVPMQPVVERGEDLLTALPLLEARRAAGRLVPVHFAAFVDEVGLGVARGGDEPRLVRT
jgi:2-phospho-L-lactate guanylyltransferase (CobY/MobA/RfbA family)